MVRVTLGCIFAALSLSVTGASAQPLAVTGHLPDLRLTLTADTGATATQDDYRNRPVLLYFGFSRCADECPLTLRHLAQLLATTREPVQVLFVSVDPADTPAVLHRYLHPFGAGRMTGLTGDPSAVAALAKRYRAAYRPTSEDGEFAHSNAVYAFDAAGRARFLITPEDTDAQILATLKALDHAAR